MRIFIFFVGIFVCGCTKDVLPPAATPYVLTNNQVSAITQTTAFCNGSVEGDYGSDVFERGFCWSTGSTPTINNSRTINGAGTGVFSSQISVLIRNTNYYVRAYATNNAGTSYGRTILFRTLN
jgi:hypothetical protein